MKKINENLKELQPMFNSQKSYYSKAKILKNGAILSLFSYDYLVAEIDTIDHKAKIYLAKPSQTTLKHIKDFLWQNNFKVVDKKQILKDYLEN